MKNMSEEEKKELSYFVDITFALARGNGLCQWDRQAEEKANTIRSLIESAGRPKVTRLMARRILDLTSEIDDEEHCVWGMDTNLGTPEELENQVLDIIKEADVEVEKK